MLAALAVACLALPGCQTPAAPPVGSPVLRGVRFAPIVPDGADHATADLLAAALVADPTESALALERLERIEDRRDQAGQAPTGLVPLAADLHNAAFLDARAYREAAEDLLERDDLSLALRGRLKQASRDDPLILANARMRDAYMFSGARLFNALAEPVGRSVLTTSLAPYRLGQSLVRYAIEVYRDDPLPLQRRQALAHWKDFLERYPQAPERPKIESRVAKAQVRWHRTQRDHALEAARRALAKGRSSEALYFSERALRHEPDDAAAEKVRKRAVADLHRERERLASSVRFEAPTATPVASSDARALALALLAPDGDVIGAAGAIPEDGAFADEARFARAGALGERGDEAAMWAELKLLAEEGGETMARHATAELADPVRNPYDGFAYARNRDRWTVTSWVLLGPAARRPKLSVDGVAEWLLRLPAQAQAIVIMPIRLVQLPRLRPPVTAKTTAVQARRYLATHPHGARSEEVRSWLESYERGRENWIGALHVAEGREPVRADDVEELRERAAQQALSVAGREERRDMRNAMLYNVAREFHDTRAGREAGVRAREELENLRPHQIRISRGFLEENPEFAGPEGLGIEPLLLDEDPSNGELHPDGVVLVGGRRLEFSFIAAGGDDDDPPEKLTATISEERLARLVSNLEEASFHNSLIDTDDALEPDAQRDLVFERARLGLSDQIDKRATAEANFAYRGMRERYGMVRSREPILPFDIVVQGSLAELSLGAFPRMRAPRETPDAMLYR
jgi:hypothetical protein